MDTLIRLAVTVCCALVEWLVDSGRPLQESLANLSSLKELIFITLVNPEICIYH